MGVKCHIGVGKDIYTSNNETGELAVATEEYAPNTGEGRDYLNWRVAVVDVQGENHRRRNGKPYYIGPLEAREKFFNRISHLIWE